MGIMGPCGPFAKVAGQVPAEMGGYTGEWSDGT